MNGHYAGRAHNFSACTSLTNLHGILHLNWNATCKYSCSKCFDKSFRFLKIMKNPLSWKIFYFVAFILSRIFNFETKSKITLYVLLQNTCSFSHQYFRGAYFFTAFKNVSIIFSTCRYICVQYVVSFVIGRYLNSSGSYF